MGRAVGALDVSAAGGVTVTPAALTAVTTDANGAFTVTSPSAGSVRLTLSGRGWFERQTTMQVPGSNAEVSLIPDTFDMTAFNQMFRTTGGRLQRWTRAPALVIVGAELTFTSTSDSVFTATNRQLPDADVQALAADLTWGLPQLTASTFSSFASVRTDAAPAGSAITVLRDGAIVVARYRGLTAATGFAGFGRWAHLDDGTVTGGAVLIDADFDRITNPLTRVVRLHEMGHALGYTHVSARTSAMNAAPTVDPNDFDREAARVAFQRVPGSLSPDTDPVSFLANAKASRPAVWAPAMP